MREYRIRWNASSNITFQGATDWYPWDEDANATDEEIQSALGQGSGGLCEGFEIALEQSGFEWWAETRPSEDKLP
jgi:hypothetical protein